MTIKGWQCLDCGTWNLNETIKCQKCGSGRPWGGEKLKKLLEQPLIETAPLDAEQEAMVHRHMKAVEAAREMADWLAPRPPEGPYVAEPPFPPDGGRWYIMDGNGNYIATVFEEPAARMILQRLNQ